MATIHEGSILDVKAHAIVNPSNYALKHHGGLARIIERAALGGDKIVGSDYTYRVTQWKRDHADAPLVATGNVHVTSAGTLDFKAVIHAVGPVWNGGAFREHELLRSAHVQALLRAYALGYESIAFPAISCGVFGFPVEQAAPIAAKAVRDFGRHLDVTFALMEQDHIDAYRHALSS